MEKRFTAAERLAWFYSMRADRMARLERINARIVALELEVNKTKPNLVKFTGYDPVTGEAVYESHE